MLGFLCCNGPSLLLAAPSCLLLLLPFRLVMDCTNKLRGKKEQFELDYSCSVLSIYLPKCFCGEPIVSEDMDMYCQQCTEDSKEFRS